MPKETLSYREFSGGINTKLNPKIIQPNEIREAKGIMADEAGTLRTTTPPAKVAGLTNLTANPPVGGRGLFSFASDNSYATANDDSVARESQYLCIADSSNSEIDLYGYEDTSNGYALSEAKISLGSGTAMEAEYYWADGALRVADASFDSASTTKWFGLIGSPGTKKRLLGEDMAVAWVYMDNSLPAPTRGLVAPILHANSDATGSATTITLATSVPITEDITLFASGGSGSTVCTAVTTGLAVGNEIEIFGTISYNGSHILTVVTGSTFTIPIPFTTDDADGTDAHYTKAGAASNFGGWATEIADAETNSENYLVNDYENNNLDEVTAASGDSLTTSSNEDGNWDGLLFNVFPFPGRGVNMEITQSVGSNEGAWPTGEYEFGQTFVYEGGQESKIYTYPSDNIEILPQEFLYVKAFVSGLVDDAQTEINRRLIGGRIYTRKVSSNSFWTLLLDMDFRVQEQAVGGGTRARTFDGLDLWEEVADVDSGSDIPFDTALTNQDWCGFRSKQYKIKHPNPESYEGLNGYGNDEHALTFGEAANYAYKCSINIGERIFVANVYYMDDTGTAKAMGDSILYTPPLKFDTFPSSLRLNLTGSDGDEFTALSHADATLLAFKKKSLYVIDTNSPNPAQWKLVSRFEDMGVTGPQAVTEARNMALWVNDTGLYMFGKEGMKNLIGGKFSYASWTSFIGGKPAIGYDSSANKVIVLNDCDAPSAMRVVDLDNVSWSEGYPGDPGWGTFVTTGTTPKCSNIINFKGHDLLDSGGAVINSNGGILFQLDETAAGAADSDIQTISLAATGTSKFSLITRDEDFGAPDRFKKIYEINVEYYCDENNPTILATYGIDGDIAAGSDFDGSAYSTALAGDAAMNDANIFNIKLVTPIKCRSFCIKFVDNSAAMKLEIININICYRIIKRGLVTTEAS